MSAEGQKKVLIIDDELDICFLFGRILHKRNMTTEFAHNLAEADTAIKNDPPFLIFLDNNLPDGQGIDFVPYLKQHYPATRVVIVTSNDSISDQKKAFLKGADDFMAKPLSLALINLTLDRMCALG